MTTAGPFRVPLHAHAHTSMRYSAATIIRRVALSLTIRQLRFHSYLSVYSFSFPIVLLLLPRARPSSLAGTHTHSHARVVVIIRQGATNFVVTLFQPCMTSRKTTSLLSLSRSFCHSVWPVCACVGVSAMTETWRSSHQETAFACGRHFFSLLPPFRRVHSPLSVCLSVCVLPVRPVRHAQSSLRWVEDIRAIVTPFRDVQQAPALN